MLLKNKSTAAILPCLLSFFLFVLSIPTQASNEQLNTTRSTTMVVLDSIDKKIPLGHYLAIYEDVGQKSTLSDIQSLDESSWMHSEAEIPSLGYSKSVFWFRLEIRNTLQENETLLLSVDNPALDNVQITHQQAGLEPVTRFFGDLYPFSQREIFNRNFILPVEFAAVSHSKIYIRVANLGSIQLPLYLRTEREHNLGEQNSLILQGIYIGLMLVMGLYNLILYFYVREKSYLLFSGFIFSNVLFDLSLHGFGFQYIWPNLEGINSWIIPASNGLVYAFGSLFISEFVKLRELSRKQHYFLLFIVVVSLVLVALSPVLPYKYTVLVLTIIAFPFTISSLVASITSLRNGNRAARFFLGSWLAYTLAIFTLAANKMGFIPRNIYTENGLQIGVSLTILFLSVALADNINRDKQKRIEADEEALRLERISRLDREKYLQADIANKEAELKVQKEVTSAREEALLAKEKSKTKSSFLATMSHEIRTPLNGILGISDLLNDTKLDRDQQEYLDLIRSSGNSLLNLINDILDFSKIEAGKMQIENRIFNLHEMSKNTIKNFQFLADDKGVALEYYIDEDVPRFIKSDSNRLQQVLLNLIGNALKFTHQGSVCLTISKNSTLQADDELTRLKFEVVDSGIGISQEDQVKLFRSFSQADGSTTRKYGGTGLGLSICKRIVDLFSGTIGVSSVAGGGSKFWFTIMSEKLLELEIEELSQTNENLAVVHELQESRSKLAGLKVLVAEDNKVNQLVVKGLLDKLELSSFLTENGEEALEYTKAHHPEIDLILMDCEMPVMDGYDASRSIRQWEKDHDKKPLPIFALTAHALDDMVQDSINAGMDAHISKPVSLQNLSTALLAHMGSE